MPLIPSDRLVGWEPGVDVGVIGGIDQYYPGGASERVTLLDVTASPYFASGVRDLTTGSISSGDNELTVADPSSWSVGNHIRVHIPYIQELVITHAADETGNIGVSIPLIINPGNPDDPDNVFIAVTSGDTATQVATKVRAATFKCWNTSGSGTTVIFTQKDYYSITETVSLLPPGTPGVTAPSVTGTGSQTQAGVLAVASVAGTPVKVSSIASNVLTLNENASATVTGAVVTHDDYPAIQGACDAYDPGNNDGVYIPAGSYNVYGTINAGNLGYYLNNRTIRGELVDGVRATFLKQCSIGGISLGSGGGVAPAGDPPIRVSSGLTSGSTSLVLTGDLSALTVGGLMVVYVESDPDLPAVSVYGFSTLVPTDAAPTKQMVRILTKVSQTVTFTPPLFEDYGGGTLDVVIWYAGFPGSFQGVEDLDIDSDTYHPMSRSNINLGNCYQSWIRNCKISHAKNYPVNVTYSLNCEVRHNDISGPSNSGSNGAGILYDGHSGLIEDNWIKDSFPIIEMNGGSSGNAWLYNYDATAGDGGAWNTNHAPFNQFNILEGNCLGHQISDGYFGGDNKLTLYRNYLFNPYGVNLKRFNRNCTVIGNFVPQHTDAALTGYPNIGNGDYTGTAEFSTGDVWVDYERTWELTTRTDANNGVLTRISASGLLFGGVSQNIRFTYGDGTTAVGCVVVSTSSGGTVATIFTGGTLPTLNTQGIVWPGPPIFADGAWQIFQEQDLDVGNTLILKENWSRATDDIDFSAGGDPVPDSLAYDAQPAWWPGGFEWPPFDTSNVSTQDRERLPAAYRYINGELPPVNAISTGISGLAKISGTVTIQHA